MKLILMMSSKFLALNTQGLNLVDSTEINSVYLLLMDFQLTVLKISFV